MYRKLGVLFVMTALIACVAAAQIPGQPNNTSEANISLVAGPIPQRVHDTTAQIFWATNSPSSTILMYGTDPNNMNQKKEEPWGQTSHSVALTGLQPGTTYYYQVVTSDGRTLDKGSFQT